MRGMVYLGAQTVPRELEKATTGRPAALVSLGASGTQVVGVSAKGGANDTKEKMVSPCNEAKKLLREEIA